jgi:hypothetical protein
MVMKMLEQRRRTMVHMTLVDATMRGEVVEMKAERKARLMKAR